MDSDGNTGSRFDKSRSSLFFPSVFSVPSVVNPF